MKIVLLFTAVLVPLICKAQFVVGNGGEGICTQFDLNDDALCEPGFFAVRDLFETEVKPEFGSGASSEISRLVDQMKFGRLEVPRSLLVRKLTDLDGMQLYFGHIVAEAILKFEWVATDRKLAVIPNDMIVYDPSTYKRVQIANRLNSAIIISVPAFKLLTAEHKVALIIHEAIFSLLAPVRANDQEDQSALSARDITAALFRKSGGRFRLSGAQKNLIPFLKNNDFVPEAATSCSLREEGYALRKVATQNPGDANQASRFVAYSSDSKLEKEVEEFCHSGWDDNKSGIQVHVDAVRKPYSFDEEAYLVTRERNSFNQKWLFARYQLPLLTHSETYGSVYECETSLLELLSGWFNKRFSLYRSAGQLCLN